MSEVCIRRWNTADSEVAFEPNGAKRAVPFSQGLHKGTKGLQRRTN